MSVKMSNKLNFTAFLALLAISGFLLISPADTNAQIPFHPVSVAIIASPDSICIGQSTRISWSSADATSLFIDQGIGSVQPFGERTVSPTQTTIFTITGSNSTGASATASATVFVTGPCFTPTPPPPLPTPPPPIPPTVSVSIVANPSVIRLGDSSILSWASSNANSCVAMGDGWFGVRPVSGNETIAPNQTTIFRITCTNQFGSTSTAQTTVTVLRDNLVVIGPSLSLIANPSTIRRGETSILTWNTVNATSCIAQGDGWFGSRNISGNETVAPTQTTIFRMTCTGSGGTAFSQTTVNVLDEQINFPAVDITANPISVNRGANSVLVWSSSNATSCFASNGWSGSKSISGSETVFPSFTITFTITCSNSRGSASDSVTVFVVAAPPEPVQPFIVTCIASPFVVSIGQETTLAAGQSGGVEPVNFVWGGIVSGTGKLIRRTMTIPGIHTVTVTATDATGRFAQGSCLVDPPAKAASINTNNANTNKNISEGSLFQKLLAAYFGGGKTSKTNSGVNAPANLSPNAKEFSDSTDSIELKWGAVEDAQSYAVRADFPNSTLRDERNNCPGNPHYLCVNKLDSTSIKIEVEPGQTYNWWVHAISSNGTLSSPAFARFSVKPEETSMLGGLFANIFSAKGSITIGLIILMFILGYMWGKQKGNEKTEFKQEFKGGALKI